MPKPLIDSKIYERFIQQRDQGLEKVLEKYQVALGGVISVLKIRTDEIASHMALQNVGTSQFRRNRNEFERRLSPWFEMGITQSVSILQSLRHTVFILSYVGQAEAIGRTLNKETKYSLHKRKILHHLSREAASGGSLQLTVEFYYHRLLRNIVNAFQLSQVIEATPEETLIRIQRAFPKEQKVTTLRTKMAKLAEAERKKSVNFSFGEIEEADWNNALKDYFSEEIPFGRAPYDKVFYADVNAQGDVEVYTRYQWEVENEITNDFVQSVRDGEIQSAKENGIDDFQWIAITDQKTDECCLWRDGLSSKEIEEKLSSDHQEDECDVSVPPAHFNCRCRVAPISSADFDDSGTTSDLGSFDDWLKEKEAR